MTPRQPDSERSLAALLAPDILDLLESAPQHVAAETEELHPNDLAEVAEALPAESLPAFLRALPPERAASVLEYLDEELRTELLETMDPEQSARLVAQMTPDERADVLDEIDEAAADDILDELPEAARLETERLLEYASDTAGGLMTTQVVSVPVGSTVESALARVREIARGGRREAMNTVYVTEADGTLRGVMSLRELLAAPEGATVSDIAWTEVVSVPASTDREHVAQLTKEYDFVALPVVDERDRLLGVITVDDVIDVIEEEQTEDVQKLGGMEALEDPYMQSGFFTLLRKRAGWLTVLFVGEMFTAAAMGHYEDELAKAIVLSLFIPLIISSGGNSGSQATSLILRALALKEIELRDWWRVASRELPSGLALGAILGAVGVLRIVVWEEMGIQDFGPHHWLLATTVGITLVCVVTFGTLVGSMLPFLLRRVGFDPASASAPLVATLVDVTGLVIYFSVALVLLRGTLL